MRARQIAGGFGRGIARLPACHIIGWVQHAWHKVDYMMGTDWRQDPLMCRLAILLHRPSIKGTHEVGVTLVSETFYLSDRHRAQLSLGSARTYRSADISRGAVNLPRKSRGLIKPS